LKGRLKTRFAKFIDGKKLNTKSYEWEEDMGMKRKKHIIRGSVALLLCIFLAASYAMPVSVIGQGAEQEIREFNVNLFDYNQEKILEALKDKWENEIFKPVEAVESVSIDMDSNSMTENGDDTESLLTESSEGFEDLTVEGDDDSENLSAEETGTGEALSVKKSESVDFQVESVLETPEENSETETPEENSEAESSEEEPASVDPAKETESAKPEKSQELAGRWGRPDYSRMFMFMNGRDDNGTIIEAPANRAWFSKYKGDLYVYQGLMQTELNDKGRPEYEGDIIGIDLFNPKEKKKYKAYKEVPFQFNYDPYTGFYSYSSDENSAIFNRKEYKVFLDDPINTGDPSVDGFRPFGCIPKSKLDHFGMSMEVEFYIPKAGAEELEFNFSGDDDGWVFVDGELVLDLGGIHGTINGKIKFYDDRAEGTVVSDATICSYPDGEEGGSGALTVYGYDDAGFKPDTTHTLSFFYLERGGNAANCSLEFNVPPVGAEFAFIKADWNTEARLPGATFRLEGVDNEIIREAVSNEEGIVRFTGIPKGKYILKEIEAPKGYRSSDIEYLILVAPLEGVATIQRTQNEKTGLGVWYAEKVDEQEEPNWIPIDGIASTWLWNERIPVSEEHILTVKKAVTGNLMSADTEYEFMIRFFDGHNDYRIEDNDEMVAEAEEAEEAIILNLTDIDTELQESGEYEGYYRFVLEGGQQIIFEYSSYYVQDGKLPEAVAQNNIRGVPVLQFHLVETNNQNALTTTITTAGAFGTDIPAPEVIESEKGIQGSLGSDSEDVVVTYTNAFGNKDKDKDKDKDRDRDRDRDKDKDKDDSLVIPEDPMQPFSEPKASALAAPAPTMPKTGGLGAGLFLAIGGLLAGAGIYLRRR